MKKLLLIFSVLLLTSCSRNEDTVRIGYIGPLTGDAVSYGTDTRHAAELAVAQVNAEGGIFEKSVELLVEDGGCNTAKAQAAAVKLINVSKVAAIIGGNCSTETLAIAPVAEEAGIPIIAPLSSSPAVSDAGDYVFRMYPSGALIGTIFGRYFTSSGYSRVAMLTEDTDFCRGLQQSVVRDLPEGIELVFNESLEPGTKDARSLLLRLEELQPDVLFINMQSDSAVAALYEQAQSLYPELRIVSNDIAESNTMAEALSGSLANMDIIAVATPEKDNDTAEHFVQAFESVYGPPHQNVTNPALAYDATHLLLKTIGDVGTDGVAIRDALYALEGYRGVMGTISFDERGDVQGVDYGVKHWEGKEVVQTERIEVR